MYCILLFTVATEEGQIV